MSTTKYTITIREGGEAPLVVHQNQMSETEHRKRGQLYNKAQRDKAPQKKQRPPNSTNKMSREEKGMRQTGLRSSGQDEQIKRGEKKLLQDLDKMSKNQASLDMIHNSNAILQKQNQILAENQRNINESIKGNKNQQNQGGGQVDRRQYDNMLGQIKKEVDEMKKIKEEIERSGKQFIKTIGDAGKGHVQALSVPGDINNNLKNIAEISKVNLEGLENLEAIKGLQNFNIEGYQQSINTLKKQIIQYQKESEQIQRQLKIRSQKLQKLDFRPNFDEKVLEPYQNYLKKKADSIDIFAKRQQVYEKLGHFDYGKFQCDLSQIMTDVKNEINQFHITCKQYRIDVPDIKMDQKELKGLDLKLPSAIDQFKAERGIDFTKPKVNDKNRTQTLADSRRDRRKGEAVVSLKQGGKQAKSHKHPQGVRQLNTKPVDLTTQVRYNKANESDQKTVLENQRENQRKLVEGNMKKMKKPKEDEDFQKYLEYRARQELELLYKEKKERLEKKQNQLYDYCKKDEPEVYLNLDIRNDVKREASSQKKYEEEKSPIKKEEIKEPEQEEDSIPKLKPIPGTGGQTVKEVGTQVLKQKLKNLLGNNNIQRRSQPHIQPNVHPQPMINPQGLNQSDGGVLAQNIVGVLNNALTQVNNQLSRTIQNKYEQRSVSKEKNQSYRKSPAKIQIPKLEEFAPPPTFSMPAYNPMDQYQHQQYHPPPPPPHTYIQPVTIAQAEKPKAEPKIVPKNYDHLRIKQDELVGDLEVSQDSYAADFDD